MGKGLIRKKEIKRRHKRREKLWKLRRKYALVKTRDEKDKILEKVGRISPLLSEEKFLKPAGK